MQQPHPPIFIGGGRQRILTLAGQLADIVSINFDNSAGRLGAASVASSGADETAQKLEWVRAGAGDRFDDIELEIGAYFVAVDDDPGPMISGDGRPLRRERGGVRLPPPRPARQRRLDLRTRCRSGASGSASPT